MSCQQDAIDKALAETKKVEMKRELLMPFFKSAGWTDLDSQAGLTIMDHPRVFLVVSVQDDGAFLVKTTPGASECTIKTAEEVFQYEKKIREAVKGGQ